MVTKTIKVGYCQDWTGGATIKFQIIDETINGKYVCIKAPAVERGYWGQYYLSYSVASGLFLRDKDEFTDIREETLEYDY